MDYLLLALRWAHIVCASIMIGGLCFQRFALLPSEAGVDPTVLSEMRAKRRSAWSKWVMGSITLLLLSGLVNFYFIMKSFAEPYDKMPSLYHMVFGIKFLAALALFFIGSVLTGRSVRFEKVRQAPRRWLDAAIALALLIVLLSGVLRSTHTSPPLPERLAGTSAETTG